MTKDYDDAAKVVANTFGGEDAKKGPKWAKYVPEGDFISYMPSYVGGKYIGLFEKYIFKCEETKDIRYYLYDPTKHGYPNDKKYPLLVWIHGATNSLVGDVCITYSGAELYASEKYQKQMGGAYVLVPLANEEMDENGGAKWNENGTVGGWAPIYVKPIAGLIEMLKMDHKSMGKAFISGGSSGGSFSWGMLNSRPDLFFAGIPISPGYIPTRKELEELDKLGVIIVNAIGQHDEFVEDDNYYINLKKDFENLHNIKLYLPEWVRNGDGGIASIFVGMEMGQHCLINQAQANLIYDNGKPYDETLFPKGITGFIKENFK